MSFKKNDVISLEITDCTFDGAGVGHIDGMAVFVENTAQGDLIDAVIIKITKSYLVGRLLKIKKPSKSRIAPDCPSFPQCGGCAYRHISYTAECEIKYKKVADCLKRIGKIDITPDPIVPAENIYAYRNKAQYKLCREQDGSLKIGFYANRSHRVIDCRACALEPPEFKDIVDAFAEYVDTTGVSIYDEQTGKGLIRHLYLRKGFATGQIMVCIVINGTHLSNAEQLINILTAAQPEIASIAVNINRDCTNVVLGKKTEIIYGNEKIEDILCSLRFSLSPHSFYQVNPVQTERLYNYAAEFAGLTGHESVLDLYCGTGAIGLSMAKSAREVIGVEIIPQAVADAKKTAAENGINNARFICADAQAAAKELESQGIKPDVIIVDPPRKGCDSELLETATRLSPEKIVYISCDPATLARDAAILKALNYTLTRALPIDLFPRTAHVETVVLMSHSNS